MPTPARRFGQKCECGLRVTDQRTGSDAERTRHLKNDVQRGLTFSSLDSTEIGAFHIGKERERLLRHPGVQSGLSDHLPKCPCGRRIETLGARRSAAGGGRWSGTAGHPPERRESVLLEPRYKKRGTSSPPELFSAEPSPLTPSCAGARAPGAPETSHAVDPSPAGARQAPP